MNRSLRSGRCRKNLLLSVIGVHKIMQFALGQFVHLDGSGIGVVAALPSADDPAVPEDHLGVWFGGCDDSGAPIVCTVPADYFKNAPAPVIQH